MRTCQPDLQSRSLRHTHLSRSPLESLSSLDAYPAGANRRKTVSRQYRRIPAGVGRSGKAGDIIRMLLNNMLGMLSLDLDLTLSLEKDQVSVNPTHGLGLPSRLGSHLAAASPNQHPHGVRPKGFGCTRSATLGPGAKLITEWQATSALMWSASGFALHGLHMKAMVASFARRGFTP